MQRRSFFKVLMWGLAVGITSFAQPAAARADTVVKAGYDLFMSQSGTEFEGVGFAGVPLNTYDFGGTIGVQGTGLTDTIIQRLSDASISGTSGTAAPISVQVDAIQLVSTTQTSFGGTVPYGYYYATLDPASQSSSMTITFSSGSGGTFDSALNFTIDLRLGSLTGTVETTAQLSLSQNGASWARTAPAGSELIPGVNEYLLGPNNTDGDFFPTSFMESSAGSAHHYVAPAIVPEPSAFLMGAVASAIGLAFAGWQRLRVN